MLPSVADLKAQAKRLRSTLAADGHSLTHAQSLELLARQHGFRDWNTACAAAAPANALVLALDDRVTGTYLKQPFSGRVHGVSSHGQSGQLRVTLAFDEPVDVVTHDSFSSFRSRVTCVIGPDGLSPAKTSDGEPHLRLRPEGK
ncbi:glyoxalase superfamily protein [Roseibium aggregatum]|uniref:Glyoxalase-related protein domain-containing protein n=1 Tax=Roseibium aggregatum TaxID=187304 RepID=A0A939EAT5_9HYPH|nr:glyoxalase superfamily protein [Roseibium aggregatum]MBN9669217.1 hypothetical protein [Roseibium aggregatum]